MSVKGSNYPINTGTKKPVHIEMWIEIMKRRSKKITRAMDEIGEIAQWAVPHTSRKTPKFIREGEGKKQIDRLAKELVKKRK